jgi:hypothetical protein
MDRAKTHPQIRHVGHPQRKETEKEYGKKEKEGTIVMAGAK